jgi:ADP-ribose pyrophosphatase YjhB (NUDIX family)
MSRSYRAALRTLARSTAYPIFYRLPHRFRIRLVRLIAPTFTVGSVVLVRDTGADGAGRMLLLRQPPGRGWSLPAGLLGRGETPLEGALRELAEESGIRLRAEQLRQAVPNAVVHHHGRWVDMVFEASVPAATTPLVVDSVEVLEAAWHPLDKLPRLTRPTARLLGCYGIGPCVRTEGPEPAFDGSPPAPDREPAAGDATGAGRTA